MIVDVFQYGATGDGVTLDTQAIQTALDICNSHGGGTVLFPPGIYLTGTIHLKSNVTLNISAGATLLGSRQLRDYAEGIVGCCFRSESHLDKCLLYAEGAEAVTLTGRGVIDGQGEAFPLKIPNDESSAQRPMLIRLVRCRNISLDGLTLKNAGSWCLNTISCDDVKLNSLTVNNRVNRNNDGIDLNNCRKVFISNCNLSCSDDAICLQNTETDRIGGDIVITNCIISSRWAGIRCNISIGRIRNVTVSNCIFYDTFGCCIKIQADRAAIIENFMFTNLIMENVTGPISLRYGKYAWNKGDPAEPLGLLRNIYFNHIHAHVTSAPKILKTEYPLREGEVGSGIVIQGGVHRRIENIQFNNLYITFPGGGTEADAARIIPEKSECYPEYFIYGILPAYAVYVRHAKRVSLNTAVFDLLHQDKRLAILYDDVKEMSILNCKSDGRLLPDGLNSSS